MEAARFQRGSAAVGRWSAIALGMSIPLSVALDNILLAVMLAGWLASGALRDKLALGPANRVFAAALLLLALLALGTAYGHQATGDAVYYLRKYLELALIPVFAWFFREATVRRRGLMALAASLVLTLVLSLALKLGVLPPNELTAGNTVSPIVLKDHLTHNILMAFGAYLFAWFAVTARSRPLQALWATLATLAAVNVTTMVQGATGYLVLGTLALVFGYGLARWRGLAVAACAVIAIAFALLSVPGPFKERVRLIEQEYLGWEANRPQNTSIGLRLEFYRNTLDIIAEHPLVGVGTGGFPNAYEDRIRGTGMRPARNPHNEYLHIAVQLGPLGLAALLWLFWQQWRLAPHLAGRLERELARGLVTTFIVGCVYNSLLLDHTEGLLFSWLTGLLYATLRSEPGERGDAAPQPDHRY